MVTLLLQQLSDLSWLKEKNIILPINLQHHGAVKGVFRFMPASTVQVIGSLATGTCNRRHGKIDIAVEMPEVCFNVV